jgi:hypothetical protein
MRPAVAVPGAPFACNRYAVARMLAPAIIAARLSGGSIKTSVSVVRVIISALTKALVNAQFGTKILTRWTQFAP